MARLLTLIACVLGASVRSAVGDDAARSGSPPAFRRVLVPADSPQQWPVGRQRYLPIDRQELQELLAVGGTNGDPDARVRAVELEASLNAEGVLVGGGTMQVELNDAVSNAFVAWPYRSMRLSNARWRGTPGQQATLGAWPTARVSNAEAGDGEAGHREAGDDATDKHPLPLEGFLAPAAGELAFRFSLSPIEGSDPPRFVASLPAALQRVLKLRLPLGTTPVATAALVDKVTQTDGFGIEPQAAGTVVWRLRPHAGQPLAFLLEPDRESRVERTATRYSVETVASVRPGGVETVTEIILRSGGDLPEKVAVNATPDESILAVAVDGESASWRWETAGDETERLVVDIAGRRLSREAKLTLRSWTPLIGGGTWRLEPPTLPSAVFAEGSARVIASSKVRLVDVADMDETRFSVREAPSPTSAETFAFQFLRSGAGVSLAFELAAERVALQLAHKTQMGTGETRTIATAALLKATAAAPLAFEIAEGWAIDTVDSRPASALADWSLEKTASGQRLVVSLNGDPAGPAQEPSASGRRRVAIRVSARLATPANRRVLLADLAPVQPIGAELLKSRLALSAEPTFGLRLSSPDTGIVSAEAASPTPVPPTPSPSTSPPPPSTTGGVAAPLVSVGDRVEIDLLLLASERGRPAPSATLLPKPRRYDAAMTVELDAADSGLRYRAEVSVEGPASPPSVLVVAFATPLPADARWVDTATGETVDARREATASLRPRSSPSAERWVIRTPTANEPSRIAVESLLPDSPTINVPLPYARFATSQRGQVVLRGLGMTRRTINGRGMTATPTTAGNTLRYSYTPGSLLDFRRSTRLILGPAPTTESMSVRPNRPVRLETLTTVCRPGDGVIHAARYAYRAGLRDFRFWLPQDTRLISITNEAGRRCSVARPAADGDGLIPFVATLPDAKSNGIDRWGAFTINYRMASSSGTVSPALPETLADTDDWRWRVLVPKGWALRESSSLGWRERLLGPFGRSAGDKPFNPFDGGDWRRLGRSLVSPAEAIRAASSRIAGSEVTTEARENAAGESTPSGWAAYEFAGASTAPQQVRLLEITRRRFGLLATLVLTAAVGACLLPGRPARTILTAAGALVAALLAPDQLAPYASSVWGGVALSWPFAWLCCRLPRGRRVSSDSETARGVASLTGIDPAPLALLVALFATGTALAEPGAIETVLLPVDGAGEPVGDKHYVRDGFLKQLLLRREARRSAAPGDVVLLGMQVSGDLVPGPTANRLEAGAWTLSIEFESLRPRVRLPLPIRRDQAFWPESASVDGLPAALAWNRDDGCSIEVPEPGRGVLRLTFRPRVVTENGRSVLEVRLPAAPNARLRITHPPSLTSLRTPLATNVARGDPRQLDATLGPMGILQATWTFSPDAEAEADAAPIEALQWLRVTEQGVTAAVTLLSAGAPRVVPIQTPLGWESFDSPGSDTVELVARQRGAESPAAPGALTVARFWLKRRSPLGQIEAPAIKAVDAVLGRQRAAVSLGAGYRRGRAESPGVRPLKPGDFFAEWQAGEAPLADQPSESALLESDAPDFAADLYTSSRWQFRVEPSRHPLDSLSQQLAVAVTPGALRMRLLISEIGDGLPVMRLKTPGLFEVESVTQPGERRPPIRWTQPAPGRLVIFLPKDVGVSRLEVRGTSPRPTGAFPPPPLTVVAPAPAPSEISFWRHEGVRVAVRRSGVSVSSGETDPVAPDDWPFRHVATATDQKLSGGLLIQADPNRPAYDLVAATTAQRSREGLLLSWTAELSVREGLLGEAPVLVRIPADRLADLRVVEPADATLTASKIFGEEQRLRFASPVVPGSSVRLRLAIPINAGDEGSLTTPIVDFPGAARVRRWLAVPGAIADPQPERPADSARRGRLTNAANAYRWSVIGYRGEAEPAEAVRSLLPSGSGWRFYAAAASTSSPSVEGRVFWSANRGPRAKLRCLLAEHRLVSPAGIEPRLTSEFVLVPGGVSRCRVSLGEWRRLRSITLDGVDAAVSDQGGGAWDIELRSPDAPQLLRVEVTGTAEADVFPPPRLSTARLGNVKPDATLWAVRPRPGYEVTAPGTGWATPSRAVSFARLRALEAAAASGRVVNEDWLAVWRPRLQQAIAEALAEDDLGALENASAPGQNEKRSVRATLRRARAWLAARSEADLSAGPIAPAADTPTEAPATEWSYVIVNEQPTLAVPSFAVVSTSDLSLRVLLATAVVVGASAARRRIAGVDLAAVLRVYRHAFGAAGGVLWWLLLEPSVVGLLLLAASVAGQLRSLLRRDW